MLNTEMCMAAGMSHEAVQYALPVVQKACCKCCTVDEVSTAPSPCSQVHESTLLTSSMTLPAYTVAVIFLVHRRYDEARVLLREGAEVDTADAEGNTPLMLASRGGHGRLVKLLVRKGATLDALNAEGTTAQQMATQYHQQGIAAFLRESYARSH